MDHFWRAAIVVAVALTAVRTLKAFTGFFPPWSTWLWFAFGLSPGPFVIGGFFLYRRHTVRALERKLQRMRRVNEQAKAEADEADAQRLQAAVEAVKAKTMEGEARLQAELRDAAAARGASAPIADAAVRDVVGQLERLASLHAQGHLSEGEFDAAKQRVLRSSDSSGSAAAATAAPPAPPPPTLPPPAAAAAALSASAAALRALLDDASSSAARAQRAAYRAAITFSPDEDLLLFVQEASAWRRSAQREEAAAAPAEGAAARPARRMRWAR